MKKHKAIAALVIGGLASCQSRAIESAALPAEPEGHGVPTDPVCLWPDEGFNDVLEVFLHPEPAGGQPRAESALDRHFVAHGWGGWIGSRRPVPDEPTPACHGESLVQLRDAALANTADVLAPEAWKIAELLDRNGQAEAAQRIRDGHPSTFRNGDWFRQQWDRAQVHLEAGRLDWAYYHFSNYAPPSFCGSAISEARKARYASTVHCLGALERWEELRAVCRAAIRDPLGGSTCYFEVLAESHEREGHPDAIQAEFDALRPTLDRPPYQSPQGLDAARTHWEILQLSDEEAFPRIPELLDAPGHEHDERVDALLEWAGTDGIHHWVQDLDRRYPDWTFVDRRLLHRLADTGNPGLRPFLGRWLTYSEDLQDSLERVRASFEPAEDAWWARPGNDSFEFRWPSPAADDHPRVTTPGEVRSHD